MGRHSHRVVISPSLGFLALLNMRQFILTVGTLSSALASCWFGFQGFVSISHGELARSLLFIFIATPILLSLAVTFDYVNSSLHQEYRNLRRTLARKKGAQLDIHHPRSKEVENTPWEDDSSHTH